MATTTTNLGLRKPEGTDTVSVTTDIANNMQVIDNTFVTGTPVNQALGDVAAAGTALQVARADHKHGMPAFGTPVSVGTAIANGVSANVARSDHVHDLQDDVVTAVKLRDDATTDANRAVTTNHIRDDAVTAAKIGPLAVSSSKIATGGVSETNLADDAVTAAKLRDDAATDANRAVTTDHIRDGAVTTAKLASVITPPDTDPPAANQLTRGGLVKGWAMVTITAGTPALADDYNVSGLVDNGVGDVTVSWDRDFASANYAVGSSALEGVTSGRVVNWFAGPAAGSIRAKIRKVDDNSAQDTDFSLIVCGDQ